MELWLGRGINSVWCRAVQLLTCVAQCCCYVVQYCRDMFCNMCMLWMCCAMLLLCCAITCLCFTVLANTVPAHTHPRPRWFIWSLSRGVGSASRVVPVLPHHQLPCAREGTIQVQYVVCLSVCLSVCTYVHACLSICVSAPVHHTHMHLCMYDLWGRNVIFLPLAYFVIASTHVMLMTRQWDPKPSHTITTRYNSVVVQVHPYSYCLITNIIHILHIREEAMYNKQIGICTHLHYHLSMYNRLFWQPHLVGSAALLSSGKIL